MRLCRFNVNAVDIEVLLTLRASFIEHLKITHIIAKIGLKKLLSAECRAYLSNFSAK